MYVTYYRKHVEVFRDSKPYHEAIYSSGVYMVSMLELNVPLGLKQLAPSGFCQYPELPWEWEGGNCCNHGYTHNPLMLTLFACWELALCFLPLQELSVLYGVQNIVAENPFCKILRVTMSCYSELRRPTIHPFKMVSIGC